MKALTSLVTIAALLATAAVAQLPPGTPKCAIPCYVKNVAVSPCKTDIACLCKDEVFVSNVTTCVQSVCIIEDALLAKNASATACGIEPSNVGPMYTETSAIMTGFALFFTILRVVYRQFITQLGLGADDWTTIVAALSCIPATVLNARLADFGVGRDIWTLTPYQITMFGQTFYALTMIYFLDMALLKLSILFFFLRIFPDIRFKRIVWVTIGIVAMFGIAYVLAAAFQCWPVSYNWTRWNDRDNQGTCVDYSTIAWANAAVSIALDIWMLYLPLSQISSLKLDWRKKAGIIAMFVVGTFVTVVSIIRLASIVKFRSSENITHDTTAIATWSTVEICTGVICACMPSMRLILGRLWPNIFGSTTTLASSGPYPSQRYGTNNINSAGLYYNKNTFQSVHEDDNTTSNGISVRHQVSITSAHRKSARHSGRFSRPKSFFSGSNITSGGGHGHDNHMNGTLTKIESGHDLEYDEEDSIELRTHGAQVPVTPPGRTYYTGGTSTTNSSDLDLPRQK